MAPPPVAAAITINLCAIGINSQILFVGFWQVWFLQT